MKKEGLRCEIRQDRPILEKYSTDMSGYRAVPTMVAYPETEQDVIDLLELAKAKGMPVTARAAGSNLSGNAVGGGAVVVFTRMKKLIGRQGEIVRFQPGLVYDDLNRQMAEHGLFLPYHVSSSRFCSLGGNVATRASGLRSIKYGTVDTSVRNIRMISPGRGIVDTRQGLAADLGREVMALQEQMRADPEAMAVLDSRKGLKTSLGYNLWALDAFETPEDIVAHLVVGSVGTLGLFTEIEMTLQPIPEKRLMIAAFFPGLNEAAGVVQPLRDLNPSLLELMDAFGTNLARAEADLIVPESAASTLLVEFDAHVESCVQKARQILEARALACRELKDADLQMRMWGVRAKMLLEIKKANETVDRKYLSFVDDLAVPPGAIAAFITEIEAIFREEGIPVVIYGHIGEGNLHVRPLMRRVNWKSDMRRIGDRCFETVFKFNGTVAAEHGAGRNRSEFIRKEWGDAAFSIMQRVKEIFDPDDLMNPGFMFADRDFTEGLEF